MENKINSSDSYRVIDRGLTSYDECYRDQRELFERSIEGRGEDTLIITRHEPTVTLGKSGDDKDLLASREFLTEQGVEFVEVDRGGGITYHGPGQIVLYPVFDLRRYGRDLRRFVRKLGFVAKTTVEAVGLEAEFREGDEIGLWVKGQGRKKLASLGLRVKKWYTMHGLALNVELDEEKAGLIRPCGVGGAQLVSVNDYVEVELDVIKELLLDQFHREFGGGEST